MCGHLLHAEGPRGGLIRSCSHGSILCSHVSIFIWRASQKRRYSKSRKREKRRRHVLDFATSPRFPIYTCTLIRAWLWKHLKKEENSEEKGVDGVPLHHSDNIVIYLYSNLTTSHMKTGLEEWGDGRGDETRDGIRARPSHCAMILIWNLLVIVNAKYTNYTLHWHLWFRLCDISQAVSCFCTINVWNLLDKINPL